MKNFKVIRVIQSVLGEDEPVEVSYYNGPSHVKAITAMVMAADDIDDSDYYTVKSVTLTITDTEEILTGD